MITPVTVKSMGIEALHFLTFRGAEVFPASLTIWDKRPARYMNPYQKKSGKMMMAGR